MSKIYRTDPISKLIWILLHPIKWHKSKSTRKALDDKFRKYL